MKFITITGKKFELASLKRRLSAFLIDVICLFYSNLTLLLLFLIFFYVPLIAPDSSPLTFFKVFLGGRLKFVSLGLSLLVLLFIDGFDGRGFGKRVMSLQVVRLKDGKPGTFIDSFIRRLASIFQPFYLIRRFGKKRQWFGDKLARTVVVKPEPEAVLVELEPKIEDAEEVLEAAIFEIGGKLSKAREQVDKSIEAEKQFQRAYESAAAQAERCQASVVAALKAEREDAAREELVKRNEYRQLADQRKKQCEKQKQVVQSLSNFLEYLQQKMMEAEIKKAVIVAQHRNVDAEARLREILVAIEDNEALETFVKMEREATEAAILEKAAAEVDIEYREAGSHLKFEIHDEEAEIDKELAELKTKLP